MTVFAGISPCPEGIGKDSNDPPTGSTSLRGSGTFLSPLHMLHSCRQLSRTFHKAPSIQYIARAASKNAHTTSPAQPLSSGTSSRHTHQELPSMRAEARCTVSGPRSSTAAPLCKWINRLRLAGTRQPRTNETYIMSYGALRAWPYEIG